VARRAAVESVGSGVVIAAGRQSGPRMAGKVGLVTHLRPADSSEAFPAVKTADCPLGALR
jgi:hypothetical protein